MKKKQKEILWFLGTIILILFNYHFLFGINSLFKNETLDLNIKDTYYVLDRFIFFVPMTITFFFFIYLIRMLIRKFNNLTANTIFLITNLFFILLFTYLIESISLFAVFPNTTVYPPLSGGGIEQKGNGLDKLYYCLLFVQILLIIFQTFVGIKTGIKYKLNTLQNSSL